LHLKQELVQIFLSVDLSMMYLLGNSSIVLIVNSIVLRTGTQTINLLAHVDTNLLHSLKLGCRLLVRARFPSAELVFARSYEFRIIILISAKVRIGSH
jgi:hypothetical protein